jgi:hypothetical protein
MSMETKESLKFDLKLVLAAAYAIVLISLLVRQRGLALAISAHIGVVLGLSMIRFGQEFLRILFLPLVAIVTVFENWRVQRYVKVFKRDVPAEAVIFLAYPNWMTLEGWLKPNFTQGEMIKLVAYLKARRLDFSFYTHASLDDVKKVMRDPSVTEVGFFGHGDSHVFRLSNGTTVFYCDYNDDRCAKKFVHQLHCGTREGKSLVDYVVPEVNKASCYFFRKTVTGLEIMKWLEQKTKEALAGPLPAAPDPALRDKWMEMSIREIWTQCKFAVIAFNNLTAKGRRGTDLTFSSAHSFLSHAANVSKLLKANDIASPFAGGVVGDELGITESSPIHDRRLRNNLEHYDERLQKWITDQGPRANIGTYNIGPRSAFQISGLVYVTHYDPATKTFTFVNEDFDLTVLDTEIQRIQNTADAWVSRMEAARRRG